MGKRAFEKNVRIIDSKNDSDQARREVRQMFCLEHAIQH